tara:strand:+ start:1635 stop:2459 length:825 start_codon:yes stop_codon:yes gene_type:complete
MKKQIIVVVAFLMALSVTAQKKAKIDGNKVVVDVFKTLDEFHSIEIGDNLEVNLTQTADNGYHLKTDENLVDVIKFDILNGVLKIYSTHNIKKSKELVIDLTFVNVDAITLIADAELNSKNMLTFENLLFTANDDSKYELDMQTGNVTFNLNQNSKGDIVLKGDKAMMILNDNAFLKGDIVADDLDLTVNKRADLDVKGDATNLKLTATGSSDIKGKKLRATYADLNASNSADIYVNATKELKVYTKGKSYVYVYGNPEIKVDGLNDKSKIIKK